jgi:hypothetical protein
MSAVSLAHLYEKMAQEPPLVELDLKIFLANLSLVVSLGEDLSRIDQLREKTGWTENRLIYVVTKVNLGILALFDPENPRLIGAPDFAKPLAGEMALINSHRDNFNRAMTRLGARSGSR